jgi:hypothetical protein
MEWIRSITLRMNLNHKSDANTSAAVYMWISTPKLNYILGSFNRLHASQICIVNISYSIVSCRRKFQCNRRFIKVSELMNTASDGWFSRDIYLYLVQPQGTEETDSCWTADTAWLRNPAAVRGHTVRDVSVHIHPHLRHSWLPFIQCLEEFIIYTCVQVSDVRSTDNSYLKYSSY